MKAKIYKLFRLLIWLQQNSIKLKTYEFKNIFSDFAWLQWRHNYLKSGVKHYMVLHVALDTWLGLK